MRESIAGGICDYFLIYHDCFFAVVSQCFLIDLSFVSNFLLNFFIRCLLQKLLSCFSHCCGVLLYLCPTVQLSELFHDGNLDNHIVMIVRN